jgi:hypothetical protein
MQIQLSVERFVEIRSTVTLAWATKAGASQTLTRVEVTMDHLNGGRVPN